MAGEARILIVDDHRAFTDALAWRLGAEPGFTVVGVATSARGAREAFDRCRPDIVLLDADLGDDDGIDLVPLARGSASEPQVVVVTAHDDAATAVRAVTAGARAFVPKDTAADDLVHVLAGVVAGETHVPPRLLTDVITALRKGNHEPNPWREKVARLTRREQEVLELMLAGLDRAAIAERLVLSINTVRTHNKNILSKLGVHSSLEAVSVALRAGMRPAGNRRHEGTT